MIRDQQILYIYMYITATWFNTLVLQTKVSHCDARSIIPWIKVIFTCTAAWKFQVKHSWIIFTMSGTIVSTFRIVIGEVPVHLTFLEVELQTPCFSVHTRERFCALCNDFFPLNMSLSLKVVWVTCNIYYYEKDTRIWLQLWF